MSSPAKHSIKLRRRYLILVLIMAIALYVIVPQLGDFKDSIHQLRHPVASKLLAAVFAAGLTYCAAAATYCLLSFNQLRYGKTVLVQLASMFINRLLPGGVGALGVNFLYLRQSKHSSSQAAAVVAVNNVLGMVGHGVLLLTILVISGKRLPAIHAANNHSWSIILVVAAVALAGLALVIFKRQAVSRGLLSFMRELARYRKRKLRLITALLTSMCVTLLTVSGLWFCLQAVHVAAAFITVFVVFSVGFTLGTAIPSPGGLGAVETGLVAGFVAYGVPSSAALAGVLLYRILTYWLALLAGAIAFIIAQQRNLLKV